MVNDFQSMVDRLYEKKVPPINPYEFARQMVNWGQREYGLSDSEGISIRKVVKKLGTVKLSVPHKVSRDDLVREAKKRGYLLYTANSRTGICTFMPLYTEKANVDHPVYRIIPKKYVPQVEKQGLKPRGGYSSDVLAQQSHELPPRVYFFLDYDFAEQEVEEIAYVRDRDPADYVMLEVDPSKVGRGVNFYVDNEYNLPSPAVWTYSHIPPQAIKVIELDTYNESATHSRVR